MTTAVITASPLPHETGHARSAVPLPVQILTVIFYAGFAISVSIVAMAMFGVIGVALALFLAWQWARVATFGRQQSAPDTPAEATAPQPTGNAAFDAYRDETLARLEAEQAEFLDFMERLRQARDAEEFCSFLDDRKTTR